ncbi:MAG: HAD family hydrolase [Candidatus Hodarchaeota archaeon]
MEESKSHRDFQINPNKAIKYILFDFDGTIIDSMPFLENNAVSLLTKYYKFTKEEAQRKYRNTTGLPFVQQMEIISPDNHNLNSEIVDKFEKMKIQKIFDQKPFNESYEVLKELKIRRYKLGISSGTIEEIIAEYLNEENISDLVDDILGWKPGFEKGKDHFDFISSKYGFSPSEIVFIGDSLNDARRANNNGILFIARVGMFQSDDFETIIPNVKVITSLKEILEDFPHLSTDRK